jgi:hypothetical protein
MRRSAPIQKCSRRWASDRTLSALPRDFCQCSKPPLGLTKFLSFVYLS